MKIPVERTEKYKNCTIEIRTQDETLILFDQKGNKIGSLSFESILNFLTGAITLNKRQTPRTPLSLRIRYSTSGERWYESITDTIGGGGVFIETRTPFTQGTSVKVELALPGKRDKPIHAEGIVVWNRKKFERILYFPGMGIQFTRLDPEDQRILLSEINLLNSLRGIKDEPDDSSKKDK